MRERHRNEPLASVTSADIKAIRDALTAARLEGKIGAKRAFNVWSFAVKAPLSRVFTDDDPKYGTLRVGSFAANPAHGIKPPVSGGDLEEDERERQALDPAEAAALLACVAIPVDARRLYAWALSDRSPSRRALRATVVRRPRRCHQGASHARHEGRRRHDDDPQDAGERRDVPIHPHLRPLVDAMRGAGRVFPIARARDVESRVAELREHLATAGIDRDDLPTGTASLRPFELPELPDDIRDVLRAQRLRQRLDRRLARSRREDDRRQALREGYRTAHRRRLPCPGGGPSHQD